MMVWFVAGPVAIAAGISYLLRNKGWVAQLLLWVFGLPALFVAVQILTLLISFQVFGVDLID